MLPVEKLSAESLRGFLPKEICPGQIHIFDIIDSTNSFAKNLALSGEKEALVASEEQSAGRGRQGKSFYSPKSTGLYMSLLLRPAELFGETQMITIAAAVAVCRALETVSGTEPKIKWVNDIYFEERKICGILCESVKDPQSGDELGVIIGVGINCNTDSFPAELENLAGSLGICLSRNRLGAEICAEIYRTLALNRQAILSEYRSRWLMEGKRVCFDRGGRNMHAVVVGIGEDGSLIVMSGCGERIALNSGEVQLIGLGEGR